MQLQDWQTVLREQVLGLLREAGITDAKVSKKLTRFEEDEPGDTADHVEVSLVVRFSTSGGAYEVWIYPEEAGILEPGDDWWPFDRGDFTSPAELSRAVVEHLRDLVAEQHVG
jgi:hypothetical protein